MLLYLGIAVMLGTIADIILIGFDKLHIVFILIGLCLVAYGKGVDLLKNLFKNSRLSTFSGLVIRVLIISSIVILYLFSYTLFSSDKIYISGALKESNALISEKDYQKSFDMLKALSEKYPDNVSIKMEIGKLYNEQKRYDAGFTVFNDIVKEKPAHLEARYYLANSCISKKDFAGAKNMALRSLQYDFRDFYAHEILGDVYRQEADLIRAMYYYKLAVQFAPTSFNSHFKLGSMYRITRSYPEGLQELKTAQTLAVSEEESTRVSNELLALRKEISETSTKNLDDSSKFDSLIVKEGLKSVKN
jgi:hypothetical protein